MVIDIGGFTTDFLAVNPGGEVDYSLARSVPLGIQTVVNDFEESFKSNNAEAVKDTPVLPPDRVRKAIVSGVFEGGGRKFHCGFDVEEATSLFLNRFADTYQRMVGGALAWDTIILTGGGSALLFQKIKPLLKHGNVMLADDLDALAPGSRRNNACGLSYRHYVHSNANMTTYFNLEIAAPFVTFFSASIFYNDTQFLIPRRREV